MNTQKIVFLDRDGVINRYPGDKNYVTKWQEFYFLPNSLEAICRLTQQNYAVKIISNQAGIGKGIYTQESLDEITRRMLAEVEKQGGRMEVYYCPHRQEDNCDCRKPKTGLFLKAVKGEKINFRDTYFVGDADTDIEAGKNIGCKTILIGCGRTKLEDSRKWDIKPDYFAKDLCEASRIILDDGK
ncbi:MAG: HAD family hydrolase [Candidatus Omnitrophica bacterium]|nr:HAD family hydrolase [Candidatus Omnitrophota bacterium]